MAELDHASRYRILKARDRRFDGRIFVGVRTTGVYCRPICPARTPRPESCVFFPSAAAAQDAGFRPCLRCRPERSPEVTFHGTASTVSRAVALIADGALDIEGATVDQLAERLGIGERQLRRLFDEHLGASPLAVAVTRRVLFAKQLVQETRLPMVEVALASGFGSVRRFNDAFQKLYGRPPRDLRRLATEAGRGGAAPRVTLRLGYRPPYDWESMVGFFAARAVRGMEEVDGGTYRRVVSLGEAAGIVEVTQQPEASVLAVTIAFPDVRALPAIVVRLRRMFDLAADVATIEAELCREPRLAELVRARPGLRVPGAWDGFELAVRAVLGQQVSVPAARTLASRLVEAHGRTLDGATKDGPLRRRFPRPEDLRDASLEGVGLTRARAGTLRALAARAATDPRLFEPAPSLDAAKRRFTEIPGIGEWTAEYVALRALREADAFPATDVGLLRGATRAGESRLEADALARLAEPFRPFRAYVAQHLWAADAARPSEKEDSHAPSRERSAPARRRRPVAARSAPARL
ncbi:MAG TPA: AlkA N-terminal domain-containing protein [Polyangiaceae bacterium]|nr:AlkA N-terminal domain-containing protein [Polyangiaceae bacterium]